MPRLRLSSVVELELAGMPAEAVAAVRARYTRTPTRSWGKAEQGPVAYYSEKRGRLLLPRGDVGQLWDLLVAHGVRPQLDPSGMSPGVPVQLAFHGKLRPYQEQAAAALVQARQGTACLPPGAGKTVLSLAGVARLGRSTLILVPTLDLLAQWQEEASRWLRCAVGSVGGGQNTVEPICVGSVQTLCSWPPEDVWRLGAAFGLVIWDESHGVPAATFYQVANLLRCACRWGLSATPEREDGQEYLTSWALGPEVFRVTYPELVEQRYLMRPQVSFVRTGFRTDAKGLDDRDPRIRQRARHRVDLQLTKNKTRNELVLRLAREGMAAGQTVLVLVGRVAHAYALAHRLHQEGWSSWALTGRLPRAMRRDVFDRFRSGEIRCLVATTVADYGLDVPTIERTISAWPLRARGRTAQRTGRGLRLHVTKTRTELFDLLDDEVAHLAARGAVRRQVYENTFGVTPVVVEGQLEGRDSPRLAAQ